jgi:F-type H+-transporting ATPase subunit b
MVDINWTVAIQIVNFLILIFALNIILYKPIRRILLERKTKVEGLSKGIDAAGQQAEEKDQAFNDGLKEARAKGQRAKEAMVQAAAEEERKIVGKILDKARDELVAVQSQVAKDVDAVKAALEKDVDVFADAITQKILGRAA